MNGIKLQKGIPRQTQKAIRAVAAKPEHVHGIVNHVRAIKGIEIAVIFWERDDGIKISFRSRGHIAAGPIARRFGGHGHTNAASGVLQVSLDDAKKTVYAAIEATLAELDAVISEAERTSTGRD